MSVMLLKKLMMKEDINIQFFGSLLYFLLMLEYGLIFLLILFMSLIIYVKMNLENFLIVVDKMLVY